jgi:predicted GH43/DUF377 family glycosyl hydrolase
MPKKIIFILFLLSLVLPAGSIAQKIGKEVPEGRMKEIYEEIKTPFKYGLAIAPKSDSQKIDCPTVFRKDDSWYMTYLVFDGRGYQTFLAKSNDLLHWVTMGTIMSFSADTSLWDANQRAGYIGLVDTRWGGSYSLQTYKDRYWMSYFGGKSKGYEAGQLSLGMAYTSKDPATAHEWRRLSKPIFTSQDRDVRWWENKKQFKSTVIYDQSKTTGYPFVMFYNANGDTAKDNKKTRWYERIGMAVSNDMTHWKRFEEDPVVHHPAGITGDPVIQKIEEVWVMFYFGAFWNDRQGAFNRFACSYDLVHWSDWKGENLIESSQPYDEQFAHKSSVIKFNGVVYHFYCAVNKKDQRGIAVATSRDLGKSSLEFAR